MNNAQIVSLVSKVIVAASAAWVTKNGIDLSQWQTFVGDAVAIAAGLLATWGAHNFHGNNPPSAPK